MKVGEVVRGSSAWLDPGRGWEYIALEHLRTPKDNEGDRLDVGIVDSLEATKDLVLV